jgi:hypothetical protein
MLDGPEVPARAPVQHLLEQMEGEGVPPRWCVVCTCGWRSGFHARTFLWTHFTAHLRVGLEDREGRLAVMYAVAAAIADRETPLDGLALREAAVS